MYICTDINYTYKVTTLKTPIWGF